MRRVAHIICSSIAFCALATTVAVAQGKAPAPRTGVEHISGGALRALADTLALRHSPGRPLGDRGNYSYLLLRRDTSGVPEVHAEWADILLVQSGTGAMLHGGEVKGGRSVGHGEMRGGEIVGGTSQPLAPGDVLIIPPGTPHQVVLAAGERLTYLAVKIAAQHDSAHAR